jgi:Tol biopolymer transport system component
MRTAIAILVGVVVVGCGGSSEDGAEFDPDDPGVIVFNLNTDDHLRAIRPDGTGLQAFELRKSCDPQAFSRDGRIVVCTDATVPRDPLGVYAMRRDGSDWRRIQLPPGNSHSPSLSPDGGEFVFLYSRDEYGKTFELWKTGIDGADPERLVAGDNAEPAWSPDGTRIAFMRDPPDVVSAEQCWEGDLVVVDADGGDERLIAEDASAPEWSPDGKRLVFIGDCDTISVVPVDGGPSTVLARGGFEPRWSPDGKLVAFVRETGPCGHATCLQRIFVVPATGGKPRPIGPHVFDPFGFFWLPSSAATTGRR